MSNLAFWGSLAKIWYALKIGTRKKSVRTKITLQKLDHYRPALLKKDRAPARSDFILVPPPLEMLRLGKREKIVR